FSNLRNAAKEGALLLFISWRSPQENPFMTAAERAAQPILPNLPQRNPDDPGQFGLADAKKIENILSTSGWRNIKIQPVDATCAFSSKDLIRYFTRLGPLSQALSET